MNLVIRAKIIILSKEKPQFTGLSEVFLGVGLCASAPCGEDFEMLVLKFPGCIFPWS